jgi:predicted transcriptional regulator
MADLDDGATPELTFTYEVSDEGYSVRDAAALLGLTPGRVPQLLNA